MQNLELTNDEMSALKTIVSDSISAAELDCEYDTPDFSDVSYMKLCYLRALILEKLKSEKHREDEPAEDWVGGYKPWYLNYKPCHLDDKLG